MVINLLIGVFATLASLSFFPDVYALFYSLFKFDPSAGIDNRNKVIYLVVKFTSLLMGYLSLVAFFVTSVLIAITGTVARESIETFKVAAISFIIGFVYLLLLKLAIFLSKKIPGSRPWDVLAGELGILEAIGGIGLIVVVLIKG